MIFVIFDEFSKLLHRGSVKRYEHIYFLDRSRCDLLKFSRIWLGLKGFGDDHSEIRLRTMYGGCAWCELTLACRPAPVDRKSKVYPKAKAAST